MNETLESKTRRGPRYVVVYLGLVVLTLLEIWVAPAAIAGGWINAMLLAMAFAKAGLVAAYFMHLRGDPKIYTWILVLPTLLLTVFSLLSIVI